MARRSKRGGARARAVRAARIDTRASTYVPTPAALKLRGIGIVATDLRKTLDADGTREASRLAALRADGILIVPPIDADRQALPVPAAAWVDGRVRDANDPVGDLRPATTRDDLLAQAAYADAVLARRHAWEAAKVRHDEGFPTPVGMDTTTNNAKDMT